MNGRTIFYTGLFSFFSLFISTTIKAQSPDTPDLFVQPFEKKNNVQIYTGTSRTSFNITPLHERTTPYRLMTNSSVSIGATLNYKWFSFSYSFRLRNTAVDKYAIGIRGLQFRTSQFFNGVRLEGFYQQFTGLVMRDKNRITQYQNFPDIKYNNINVNIYYFFNHNKFSYLAARSYSERQKKSAGSIVAILSPSLQSFTYKEESTLTALDSTSYRFIIKQPHWFSVSGRVGYTYNYIPYHSKWSINAEILVKAGLIKERANSSLYSITGIQYGINTGYNGDKMFYLLNLLQDNTVSDFRFAELRNHFLSISVTTGLRFGSLKKKILGVL